MKSFAGFLVFIIIVVLFIISARRCTGIIIEADEEYKEYVGERIVLENDTLTIINYSIWRENVTLSNGTIVNIDFAKKNLIETN